MPTGTPGDALFRSECTCVPTAQLLIGCAMARTAPAVTGVVYHGASANESTVLPPFSPLTSTFTPVGRALEGQRPPLEHRFRGESGPEGGFPHVAGAGGPEKGPGSGEEKNAGPTSPWGRKASTTAAETASRTPSACLRAPPDNPQPSINPRRPG